MLATKCQKDNQVKSKKLEETNQVLEACKKSISTTASWKWNLKEQDCWTTRGIAQMSKPA